jgi:hypothetical protein
MKRLPGVFCLLMLVVSCAAPDEGSPTVHFLSERENDAPDMAALFEGTLTLEDGCLRLQHGTNEGYAAIWPFGFGFRTEGGEVTILDGDGESVTRVGERVLVGGGELPGVTAEDIAPYVEQPVRCAGTYWVVASVEERIP